MNIAQGDKVFTHLAGEAQGQPVLCLVTAIWPDDTGNTDVSVAGVRCTVLVLDYEAQFSPCHRASTMVYANRSQGGNSAQDGDGFAYVVDDLNQANTLARTGVRKG